MENKREKPTPEAKALSLYPMAHKSSDNAIKDKSRKMNKRWDMVVAGELEKTAYQEEVQAALTFYGGYKEVIEKTVKFYIFNQYLCKFIRNEGFMAHAFE